jgi:hypothetical protein
VVAFALALGEAFALALGVAFALALGVAFALALGVAFALALGVAFACRPPLDRLCVSLFFASRLAVLRRSSNAQPISRAAAASRVK